MAKKKPISKQLSSALAKAKDAKVRKQVAGEVRRSIKQGKDALKRVQKALLGPAARRKMEAQYGRAKEALGLAKAEAAKRERQAIAYTKRNPEKALVIAAGVAAAATALMLAIKGRGRR